MRRFEPGSVAGLPEWVQHTLESQGLNTLTFDEANASIGCFQLMVIGLASYVSNQQGGDPSQRLAEKMRAERRRRSGAEDEPASVGEADVAAWFEDDASGNS